VQRNHEKTTTNNNQQQTKQAMVAWTTKSVVLLVTLWSAVLFFVSQTISPTLVTSATNGDCSSTIRHLSAEVERLRTRLRTLGHLDDDDGQEQRKQLTMLSSVVAHAYTGRVQVNITSYRCVHSQFIHCKKLNIQTP